MKNSNILIMALLCSICFFTSFICEAQIHKYHCYTPNGQTNLVLSNNQILVKFKNDFPIDNAIPFLKKEPFLSKITRAHLKTVDNKIVLIFPKNLTSEMVETCLKDLNDLESILFAHPFFKTSEKTLQSFGEDLIIGLKSENDFSFLQQKIEEYHLELARINEYDATQYHLKTTSETPNNTLEIANLLSETDHFAFAEVDWLRQVRPMGMTNITTNDPFWTDQWHLEGATQITGGISDADMDVTAAWCTTTGHPNIKVAIIDDGMLVSHLDLTGNLLPGYNATTGIAGTVIAAEHGTNVGGIVGAVGNNNLAGVGIAWTSKIIPVQIFSGSSFITDSWAADGLDWAWKYGGADVLNNSWGGGIPSTIIDNAINRAITQGRGGLGCVVVFSAGNDFVSAAEYPSSNPLTISVGGTGPDDLLKAPSTFLTGYGSNHGTGVDVYAPGARITTTSSVNNTGVTQVFNGTSSAAPMISGIAALILSVNPGLTENQVRQTIETTCDKVGPYTYNSNVAGQPNGDWSFSLGYGRANAHSAVLATPAPNLNDLGVQQILSPSTDCGLTASQNASVMIKNYGTTAQTNIPLEYRLDYNNGGFSTWQSAGTYSGTINSFEEVTHNFTINVAAIGTYLIEVRTILAVDQNALNDGTSCEFENRKLVNTFPYFEDFELNNGGWYTRSNGVWQWGVPTIGSGTSFISNGPSGFNFWSTNHSSKYNTDAKMYLYSPCFDFSNLGSDPIFSFDLIYHLEPYLANVLRDYGIVEVSTDGGSSWTLLGSQGTGTNWYNNPSGWVGVTQNGEDQWLNAAIRLTGLAGQSQVQLRFGVISNSQFEFEGMGIDGIKIYEPPTVDASILSIQTPENNCCLTTENITIAIQNLGSTTVTSCPIQFQYFNSNGPSQGWTSAGNYNGSIPPGETDSYTFSANLSAIGDYFFEVRTILPGDADATNDQGGNSFSHLIPHNTFPYSESFETILNGWHSSGVNRSFNLSFPVGPTINSASNGSQAWVTSIGGTPNWLENSYVQSICFDFSGLTQPQISLDIINQNSYGAGANLQYSTDGLTWNVLGNTSDPDNWYDGFLALSGNPGWQNVGNASWVTAKHVATVLAGQPKVWFRIHFEGGINYLSDFDGFGFDKFEITELAGPGDAGITTINQPTSGYCLSSSETVEVIIENFGAVPLTAIPIEYRINFNGGGFGAWQSAGSYSGSLTNGNTVVYSFPVDFSLIGNYVLEVRTNLLNDSNNTNDVASASLDNIGVISTFPYAESFEINNGLWKSGGTNISWEWGIPSFLQTINSASNGTKAWVTNLNGNANENEESWVNSPCFDFSGLTSPQISLDIWYETNYTPQGINLQYSIDGGNTWLVLGTTASTNNWYSHNNICNLNGDGWSLSSGLWLNASHTLAALAGQSSVQFRIRYSTCATQQGEGFAFDNILITDANSTDVGINAINKPTSGCNLSNSEMVEVELKNFGGPTITSIPIEYRFNLNGIGFSAWTSGGTYTGSLVSGNTNTYSFSVDFSMIGNYNLEIRTALLGDVNPNNDFMNQSFIHFGNSISSFPYMEDFEGSDGGWRVFGANSSWEWGTPNNTIINTASKGTKAWVTDLNGTHNLLEASYLQSPCFDFSAFNFGLISFDLWLESETAIDGLTLEYSIDGGQNWVTEFGSSMNGHTHSSISSLTTNIGAGEGWSGSNGRWKTIQSYISPLGSTGVIYRFYFAADGNGQQEGIAIDNIMMFDIDAMTIATTLGCNSGSIKGLSGFDQGYLLEENGGTVALISPNGNDLGTVNGQVNILNAVPQANNNIYYLPRYFNFNCNGPDCSAATFPNGAVTLTLFNNSTDLVAYNTANSSSFLSDDLYITHYNGTNENCTLNDNANTTFSILDKANIFASSINGVLGFSLEFSTNSFSEFGMHGTASPLAPPPVLPVELVDFYGTAMENKNLLQWKTASEKNVFAFQVERSFDGQSNWELLSEVNAVGNADIINSYLFEDKYPITQSYYRLKIVDLDGSVEWSNIIFLERENNTALHLFPNPVSERLFVKVAESAQNINLEVLDIRGRLMKTFQKEEANFSINISDLEKGVYILQIKTERNNWVKRLVKE